MSKKHFLINNLEMITMIKIAVIFGGISTEHDISIKSAKNVVSALDRGKYEISLIYIDEAGSWLLLDDVDDAYDSNKLANAKTAIISPDRKKGALWITDGGSISQLELDVVFPVLHGKYGEDGTIQGLFEMAGINYVGCGVLASALAQDKVSVKNVVNDLNIRQADYVAETSVSETVTEQFLKDVEKKLRYPMFVKPSRAGSSYGVSKVNNRHELLAAIKEAKKVDYRVLIEEFIDGEEVECAILGGYKGMASKVGKIEAAAEFYDFDAKYNNAESKTIVNPYDIPEDVKNTIREDAVRIFEALGGYGLSRVDFFVTKFNNEIVFNEMNTLPGFTNISMYPMLWEAMGRPADNLVDELVRLAMERKDL